MRDDGKMADLEHAVVQLCTYQMSGDKELSAKDKKTLQAVFGDGFVVQDELRKKYQRMKHISQ